MKETGMETGSPRLPHDGGHGHGPAALAMTVKDIFAPHRGQAPDEAIRNSPDAIYCQGNFFRDTGGKIMLLLLGWLVVVVASLKVGEKVLEKYQLL